MALDIEPIVAGDVQLTALNARFDLVEAAINNLDGAQIAAATVTNAKLAKPRHWLMVPICFEAFSALTNGTKFFEFMLPPVDGAVNATWKYLGCSIWFRVPTTPAASNALVVAENGTTRQTVDISGAALATAAYVGFGDATLLVPVATASDKRWSVTYTKAGAPVYTGLAQVLFFSLEHVGT